jgi:hypothetical protein
MRSPCPLKYDPSAENVASSATARSLPGVTEDFATCRKAQRQSRIAAALGTQDCAGSKLKHPHQPKQRSYP